MKKIILNTLTLSLILSYSFGQKTYEIYQNDYVQTYFKQLGKENGFYYNGNNMKDSLPDGTYILYDVKRKDSLSNYKNILIRGQYKNFKKEGQFETMAYITEKKGKCKINYQHTCNYKNGEKNGIEEEYNFCSFYYSSKIMRFHGEYIEGKKQGLFMYFESGSPIKVIVYENDTIKQVLLDISQ